MNVLRAVNARLEPILDERRTERTNRVTIGLMRIVVGVLWLANIEWKRPPNFGRDLQNGLYKYVNGATQHEVLAPYTWVIEHVVLKHYTFFGWSVLLTDSALAIFLLLGLWTRPVALIGAANSVAIALSVLYTPNEWPWSYYLMIAAHLMLFATAAGQTLGVDGARRAGPEAKRRAALVLGAVAVTVGLVALVVVANKGFTAHRGKLIGWERGELKLLWFNPLSALLTAALGAVALVGARLRRPWMSLVAVAGFTVMALQVLVQWRYHGGAKWTGGVLGGTGPNFALWAMFAVGFSTTLSKAP